MSLYKNLHKLASKFDTRNLSGFLLQVSGTSVRDLSWIFPWWRSRSI